MPKQTFHLKTSIEIVPQIFATSFMTAKLQTIPGQFVTFEVAPKEYRSYSIVGNQDIEDRSLLEFMVNTRPNGVGSKWFASPKLTISAIGPSGNFRLQDTALLKVFVATSTGLAPFVYMLSQLFAKDPNSKAVVYFGCVSNSYNITDLYLKQFEKYPNFDYKVCTDDECHLNPSHEKFYCGRVTEAMQKQITDFVDTEFYVCGNPFMVNAVVDMLKQKSATYIYTEKFDK
jgi:Na+-transporting NADH:ubiquinone oxidoreductase subunit F